MLTDSHPYAQQLPAATERLTALEVRAAPAVPRSPYLACKGALDFVLAALVLVLSAPAVLVAVVLVRLTSRGPVFYSQTRLGLGGRPYTIWKIRTMHHNCESRSGPQWSKPGDPRITPFGRILRKTHLDELPQLWNVFRGEMSLVGPRPERPEFVPQLERVIPHYRRRLEVRPGMTGLAQIQLPADTDLASVRIKLAYDLYYVEHAAFWLDLRILVGTIFYVLGVPRELRRKLVLIPQRETIEGAYRQLRSDAQPLAAAV